MAGLYEKFGDLRSIPVLGHEAGTIYFVVVGVTPCGYPGQTCVSALLNSEKKEAKFDIEHQGSGDAVQSLPLRDASP